MKTLPKLQLELDAIIADLAAEGTLTENDVFGHSFRSRAHPHALARAAAAVRRDLSDHAERVRANRARVERSPLPEVIFDEEKPVVAASRDADLRAFDAILARLDAADARIARFLADCVELASR